MNKKNQLAKYVISDLVAASVVWLLFNIIRYNEIAFYIGYTSRMNYLLSDVVLEGQLVLPFFWLFIHYLSGYYNKPFGKSRISEFFTTFVTVSVGVILLFFIMILNDLPRSFHIYYQLFFSLFGLQFVLTYIPRLIITQNSLYRIKERGWSQRVLIIGAGNKAGDIAANLYNSGYTISGFIVEDEKVQVAVDSTQILGTIHDLAHIITSERIDELVVATASMRSEKLVHILYPLYRYKLPVKILADKSFVLPAVKIKTILGVPLVDVTDNNFSEAEKNIKFLLDKLFSVWALLVLSPLCAYIVWRIKKDSSGSVFFRQERIGYMGRPFMIYKFRTMYENSENDGPLLASENDGRVTPFGRIMRKYRIDELPQFWNVLKGDMSLVGPRPERKYFIDQIVKKAPYYYLLHNVRPGITSLGMVKYGYAGNVDEMIERLEYDMLYYENMSLIMDLTILTYTIKTVITGKGI
ncbi:MAG: sugar transferase [Tannerellaceae bacterium]|jgi:exopolysaccharide biosynthesis polyprenyl glycosylphosphotransferase|nr:sugar transferase [Tannerellaceae bacterium]